MENKKAHFISCFICGVDFEDEYVVLTDSGRQRYFISKNDKEVIADFKKWFDDIYLKCVPQKLTVLRYDIVDKNEFEAICVVKKMVYCNDEASRQQ